MPQFLQYVSLQCELITTDTASKRFVLHSQVLLTAAMRPTLDQPPSSIAVVSTQEHTGCLRTMILQIHLEGLRHIEKLEPSARRVRVIVLCSKPTFKLRTKLYFEIPRHKF